jgi:hypothetical protein
MTLVHAMMGVAVVGLAGCQTYGNDQGARYLQRIDTVTMSAGDAKAVNANSQALAQWPAGVGDKRIPMQGSRAARAMDCYKTIRQRETKQPENQISLNVNTGGGSQQSGQQKQGEQEGC